MKETEQQRLERLDREAGSRGRVRHSGPKAARRHYDKEQEEKDRADAARTPRRQEKEDND